MEISELLYDCMLMLEDFIKARKLAFSFFFSVVNLAPGKYSSCLLHFLFLFFIVIYSSMLQLLLLHDVLKFTVNW